MTAKKKYYRSEEANLYRKWYNTKRWRQKRMSQLIEHPLCATCERKGVTKPANIADHIEPHRGDRYMFWYGPLQSLCAPCHDHKTSVIESRGWSDEIANDGYPADKSHPWYKSDREPRP